MDIEENEVAFGYAYERRPYFIEQLKVSTNSSLHVLGQKVDGGQNILQVRANLIFLKPFKCH